MTKIKDGYAQPDVVGTQMGRKRIVFVESPQSFKDNIEALVMTLRELSLDQSIYYLLENLEDIRIVFSG